MKLKGLYVKRGWYYYRGPQVNGVRPPAVALKTQDRAEAIHLAFRSWSEAATGAEKVQSAGGLFLTALERWLEDAKAEGKHRPKTSSVSRSCLTDLGKFWGNPPLRSITRSMVLEWRKELLERPGRGGKTMSQSSVTSYLRRLQGFLTWCVKRRLLAKNPMADIQIPQPKSTKRQHYCTIEERDRLLANPPSDEIEFILLFGFYAGLRFGEILAIEPGWITAQEDRMFLTVQVSDTFVPKDGELRTIPLHPKIKDFLKRYGTRTPYMLRADRSKGVAPPAYRYNPKKQFRTHVTKCGLPWVTYHTLRHSFATHMAMKGASMVEIASMLGDTLEVTERTYIGSVPGSDTTISSL